MRARELLHKILKNAIHLKREKVLSEVVETVIEAKEIAVTRVGRRMKNSNQSRSNIRKVDRLYSNEGLVQEQEAISRQVIEFLIKQKQVSLVIDGSKLLNSEYYILRASYACGGRALAVYEIIYERCEQGSQKLYKRFLNGLKRILPAGIEVTLITDAEFRGPWFKLVKQKGWNFIGRIRSNRYCYIGDKAGEWVSDIFKQASCIARCLGRGLLNQKEQVAGYFYLQKQKPKGRHAYTRSGRHSETIKSLRYAKGSHEPWLIFSSKHGEARDMMKRYSLRMTIEENFRDMKSPRYGLGLDMTYSKSKLRYQVMLIVAMLASLIAYLMGCVGEHLNLHRHYQANSLRTQRVLSRFFLGCEMLYHGATVLMQHIDLVITYLSKENTLEI